MEVIGETGGGVSVGAHSQGKVVDVNNILDGEGAFSPERAGTVPVGDLVKMCYSGKYTEKEVYKKICGNGGLNAYLHTNDFRDMQKMAEEGDEYAALVRDAFFYQISKDAGAMAAVLHMHLLPGRCWKKSLAGSLRSLYIPVRTSCWLWHRVVCALSVEKKLQKNIKLIQNIPAIF